MWRSAVAVLVILLAGCAQLLGIDKTTNCGPDEELCDGRCVDVFTSNMHCGTCGTSCSEGEVCGNGTCGSSCPIDQESCSGTCSDLQSDPANCGACGMACSGGDICVFGGCEKPCDPSQLSLAITDSWGVAWDALERPPAALDVALVTCRAFGGQLPTATELYRVAANQSGRVGMIFNTNFLWSQSANDNLNQATIRLSDGASSSGDAVTPTPYRCVCGARRPKTFTGNRCNGDPGNSCFEVNGYNIDAKDRPALRKSAAIQECLAERAHLIDAPLLAQAIRAGLPNGTGFTMTADQANYHASTALRWTGVAATWDPAGNIQMVDNRNPSSFRCAASKRAQTPNPVEVANPFVPAISKYKSETADSPPASFVAAHDACFARGGHLPRATELAELIAQSLPNGSGGYLWSADQTGYDPGGNNFLVATKRWLAQDPRHGHSWDATATQTVTWDWKYSSHAYRCIYYPVDPTYVAPTTCSGGCFEVALPGIGGAKLWFDSTDRAASTLGPAFGACQTEGGHLASERDYTEAIRKGLPNGTAAMVPPWLWTSDFAQNNVTIVRWTDVETAFTDQYTPYMTWANPAAATNIFRYRCMWTNELR